MDIVFLLIQIGFLVISYILHKRIISLELSRISDLIAVNNALQTIRKIDIQQNKWLKDISDEIVKHKKQMDETKSMGLMQ